MQAIQSLKVSISGVRGIVGEALTPQLVVRFAQAFGAYLDGGTVVLGRDTRLSGEMVREATLAGLLAVGCRVIDLGVCPVPTVQWNVRQLRADGGIALTASHNPQEWNALKFISASGLFLNHYQADELLDVYHQGQFPLAPWNRLGRWTSDGAGIPRHLQAILERVEVDLIRSRRFHVAIDCCNGAGAAMAPQLLEALGCRVERLNVALDQDFPHKPEPVPENLTQLCQFVRQTGAEIGFAQDADADRLAIVSEQGVPLGDEYTLVLAADFVLSQQPGVVVTNLSTTRAVEERAHQLGSRCVRTRVGEINVVTGMQQEGAAIGGEGNGGIIYPALHYARDSLMGMALILEHLARQGGTVGQLKARMPAYFMATKRYRRPDQLQRLYHHLAERYRQQPGARINLLEGVRIDLPDRWCHVRASNTEPILRLYAEAATPGEEEAFAAEIHRQIEELLGLELPESG
jgi:phosphomannomutase